MPNNPEPAAATGLPMSDAAEIAEPKTDLLDIQDELDEADLLVQTAFKVAPDLEAGEPGEPLRTLLNVIERKLRDLSERLSAVRGWAPRAPRGEQVEQ